MKKSYIQWQLILERTLPWFVLGVLLIFTYAKFFATPYVGFVFSNGKIVQLVTSEPTSTLKINDQLVRIGQIDVASFLENTHQTLFNNLSPGDSIPIILERDGKTINVEWEIPVPNQHQILQRINDIWWLPYVFWMAGTASLLFIRPKDTRWKLLVAFNFLTAIWLGAGSGPSQWHIWKSAVTLRSVIWLCLPVYLHFHWEFPFRLAHLPKIIWKIIYALGIYLAIAEWLPIVSTPNFFSGFLIAVLGSIILILLHAITEKEYRKDIQFLGIAVALMLLPSLGITLVSFFGDGTSGFTGGSFLTLPALPGAYFFVAFRRLYAKLDERIKQLTKIYLVTIAVGTVIVVLLSLFNLRNELGESTIGLGVGLTLIATFSAITGFLPFLALPALAGESIAFRLRSGDLEIRANRLLSLYLFVIFVGSIVSVTIISIDNLLNFPGKTVIIGSGAALVGSLITALGYTPFQRFVERYILGIKLPPDDLIESYSGRIMTSLDHQSLTQLLKAELLSSLLVRQSVILRVDELNTKPFVALGVTEAEMPSKAEIQTYQMKTGKLLASDPIKSPTFNWIRVVLPLKINRKLIGLWFFGKRDPDDYYSQAEISLLQTLANQTAIALINIEQSERLHGLYQSSIDWHEREQMALARELHDDVLGDLVTLTFSNTSTSSVEFQESFYQVTTRIRQMISGLRPTMLDYGLRLVLEEYIDELSERFADGPFITLSIPHLEIRYEPKVEEQLFRIVQQACENACRHAQSQTIKVYGALEKDQVTLIVKDDGVGFEFERLDFNTLLAEKHFGLVGMIERAAIIGADINFMSSQKNGTEVVVHWTLNHAN